jgi:hypothetical protein
MKNNINARIMKWFFASVCKPQLKKKGVSGKAIKEIDREYARILLSAKDMNDKKFIGSYVMGIYFIAMNRCSGLDAETNYEAFAEGLKNSALTKKFFGDADSYLDEKKLPDRLKWAEESHKRKNENNWVVDVLPANGDYDLGYDYHECGICKICADEGCPELASYLCRMDYVLADIIGMKLTRTMTLADGYEKCDFRYSRK